MSSQLSAIVIIPTDTDNTDQLYTFEYAASVTQTSIMLIQVYIQLGVIEPIGDFLHSREVARIDQIQRLRRDLGLNLVGAAMVLDMAQEMAQLRAQLEAHRSDQSTNRSNVS
jgi:MerR HTH family regulatory protein